jgi:molybdenum cofactor guanylyltransferase
MELEACILAGGKSSRMGSDKAEATLGGLTLLAHVQAVVDAFGLIGRLIREDSIESCGPLSGIATAFLESDAKRIVFLSCDMPFVKPSTLSRLTEGGIRAGFASDGERFGFPFCLHRDDAAIVTEQIHAREFSLQRLARRLGAQPITASSQDEYFNVNTPADLKRAIELIRQ